MKKILLILLSLLMISCTIPYDAETRLLFETKLVDSNENSLNGIDLEIRVSNGTGYASSNETISFGKTNENGEIRLVFPSPEFERGYDLSINSPYNDNNNYVPFEISNISFEKFNNYKLTIPKIYRLTYDESVTVTLDFIPTNNSKKITNVVIDGIYSPSFSSYNNEDETYYTYEFFAKKNQTIQLSYTVKNLNSEMLQTISQEINIGEESLFENINY